MIDEIEDEDKKQGNLFKILINRSAVPLCKKLETELKNGYEPESFAVGDGAFHCLLRKRHTNFNKEVVK